MQTIEFNSRSPKRKSAVTIAVIITVGFVSAVATCPAAHAQVPSSLLPRNLSPWGMFVNADIVVKTVMVGLAFASLVTWTVWLAKTIELRRAKRGARGAAELLGSRHGLCEAVRAFGSARDAVAQLIRSPAREAEFSGGHFDDGLQGARGLRLERVEAAMTRQSRAASASSRRSAPSRRSSACSARSGAS